MNLYVEQCACCNSKNISCGYGFAGGALGYYELCEDCCTVLFVRPDPDAMPPGVCLYGIELK